jgi:hypothetical protein
MKARTRSTGDFVAAVPVRITVAEPLNALPEARLAATRLAAVPVAPVAG